MKVILLALDGDRERAREQLRELYPAAEIEEIARVEIETGSPARRLAHLRARRPDIFAVSTERLQWQRGQNTLLLVGALAGAERSLLLDNHGARREETRARIMLSAPARTAFEMAASLAAIVRARARVRRLEREVMKGDLKERRRALAFSSNDAPDIVYLRTTPGAGTQVGGASSHINGFINAALRQGARVRLVSNDRIAGLDESKVPLKLIEPEPVGSMRVAFELYNDMLFTRGALDEIERARPTFIYQRYSRFTSAGVEATLRTGRPLFLEFNGSEVWVGRYWDRVDMLELLARFERLNLEAAARIFVVSEVERRSLLRAGVAEDKIVVNPNGVDAEMFRPDVGGINVRRQLGVEPDETLVGFIGTFGPWHGVLVLAHAIALMPSDARIRFLLVGAGSLRDEAAAIIREGGAGERAIFTGVVGHERVPAMLDACDILVSPHIPLADGSEFFGSPTKLFEYMAMGKAIVASRLGQIGDVLTDEETALLVEPADARALSDAVLRLAREPELRTRLGAAARREATAHHTWAHNAARVLDAYRNWRESTNGLD
ncbi:MAG TPA: glycosyltransferase family 4 protein [Pyrinomonadaceae bacterium]|jgi:glycosyltransferase involved in cell wall biosynthesis